MDFGETLDCDYSLVPSDLEWKNCLGAPSMGHIDMLIYLFIV